MDCYPRDSKIFPIELMRAGFVTYPISFGVPEWAGFESEYTKTSARQAL